MDEALRSLDSVWDISRWIAAPQHRRATNPRWPSNHQRELMVGILEFCLSRGLTHLTVLAEDRLAERIAAYGWPLRYLGAPRAYEGGKGIALAAEIEVGRHVLTLTRAKSGVTDTILVEINPENAAPNGPMAAPVLPSDDIQDVARDIGTERLRRLVRAIASDLAGANDRPRAIELIGAINRLLEAGGFALEDNQEPALPARTPEAPPQGRTASAS